MKNNKITSLRKYINENNVMLILESLIDFVRRKQDMVEYNKLNFIYNRISRALEEEE